MLGKYERLRLESGLMAICGSYHTFHHWTKILLPFAMWSLQPRPEVHDMLLLNAFGATASFFGTFIAAHMIESVGLRRTAIVMTAVTSLFQFFVFRTQQYWYFAILQGLCVLDHMPMIIDACVGMIEGENGDDKRRTRLLNRLTIPMSFGIAAGPYVALQVMFYITTSLETSQSLCAALNMAMTVPFLLLIPDTQTGSVKSLPSLKSYVDLLQSPRAKWSIILLFMVLGPYCAYDQVVRIQLTATVVRDPYQLNYLFLVLGGTAIAVNLWFLPRLQSRYGPQQLLQATFALLTASYLYLSQATTFISLLIGMPLQVIGVSIALGELSSQVLSSAGKKDNGKAAALIRMAHMFSVMMTPLVTGYYVDEDETSLLCYVSAVVSLCAIPVLHKFCKFMRTHTIYLPTFEDKLH